VVLPRECYFRTGGLVYDKLKEKFTTELVLVTLDLDREMRVEANVSDFAMRGVLPMKCEDER